MPHILGGLVGINISLQLPIINLCIASENKNNLSVLTELLFEQSYESSLFTKILISLANPGKFLQKSTHPNRNSLARIFCYKKIIKDQDNWNAIIYY